MIVDRSFPTILFTIVERSFLTIPLLGSLNYCLQRSLFRVVDRSFPTIPFLSSERSFPTIPFAVEERSFSTIRFFGIVERSF